MKSSPIPSEHFVRNELYGKKYLAVRNYILGAIRASILPKGSKIPSEYMLADRLGINKTTCNKAVSTLVAEGYLERRKGAGTYVIDEFSQHVPCIGVLADFQSSSFFMRTLMGIQEKAANQGYGVLFFQAPRNGEDPDRFHRYVLSTGICGLIIHSPFFKPLPHIHNIYMNTAVPYEEVNQVQNDDFHGGYLLGKHFAENGHEYVAFVSHDISRNDLLKRARGFQKAVSENKLRGAYTKLQNYARAEHHLQHVLRRLLDMEHRISAIGFDTIYAASEAYNILRKLNRRIPDEISIAGFGNFQSDEQTVRLTAINQRPVTLGHITANSLIDLIEGRITQNVNVTVPVELQKGDSVNCMRNNTPTHAIPSRAIYRQKVA